MLNLFPVLFYGQKSSNFFFPVFQKERLEREMEIKRVREELLVHSRE
jgi:hypothetical protein